MHLGYLDCSTCEVFNLKDYCLANISKSHFTYWHKGCLLPWAKFWTTSVCGKTAVTVCSHCESFTWFLKEGYFSSVNAFITLWTAYILMLSSEMLWPLKICGLWKYAENVVLIKLRIHMKFSQAVMKKYNKNNVRKKILTHSQGSVLFLG